MKKLIYAFILMLLTACNFPLNGAVTPTPNVTQAYQTIQAEILTRQPLETNAALGTPFPTLETPIPTSIVTTKPAQTSIPTLPVSTAVCDRIQPGIPIDVTIPDDSIIPPGETFVKTWRLVNAGNCTWNASYALIWFSGEPLSEQRSFVLGQVVPPGSTLDLSVEMKAPATPGTYQSNWKLQNNSGQSFGIGPSGNSPFWVRIIVPNVITPSTTPTSTATKTAAVLVNGTVLLSDGDGVFLSTLIVGTDPLSDLIFKNEVISAQNGTRLSTALASAPDRSTCMAQPLNTNSIPLSSMFQYFCFKDPENHPGWIKVLGYDTNNKLAVEVLTWDN